MSGVCSSREITRSVPVGSLVIDIRFTAPDLSMVKKAIGVMDIPVPLPPPKF